MEEIRKGNCCKVCNSCHFIQVLGLILISIMNGIPFHSVISARFHLRYQKSLLPYCSLLFSFFCKNLKSCNSNYNKNNTYDLRNRQFFMKLGGRHKLPCCFIAIIEGNNLIICFTHWNTSIKHKNNRITVFIGLKNCTKKAADIIPNLLL